MTLNCCYDFCVILASIQVAQYEDKFIDFFRRTMIQLKTVRVIENK